MHNSSIDDGSGNSAPPDGNRSTVDITRSLGHGKLYGRYVQDPRTPDSNLGLIVDHQQGQIYIYWESGNWTLHPEDLSPFYESELVLERNTQVLATLK